MKKNSTFPIFSFAYPEEKHLKERFQKALDGIIQVIETFEKKPKNPESTILDCYVEHISLMHFLNVPLNNFKLPFENKVDERDLTITERFFYAIRRYRPYTALNKCPDGVPSPKKTDIRLIFKEGDGWDVAFVENYLLKESSKEIIDQVHKVATDEINKILSIIGRHYTASGEPSLFKKVIDEIEEEVRRKATPSFTKKIIQSVLSLGPQKKRSTNAREQVLANPSSH